MTDERIETIREALASLDATNYTASDNCHNSRMVRQAKQLLEAALSRLESGEKRGAKYETALEYIAGLDQNNSMTANGLFCRAVETAQEILKRSDGSWTIRQALADSAPQGNSSETPNSSPVADGAREGIARDIARSILPRRDSIWYADDPNYDRDIDEAAALITRALREEREKAAERAEDKLRNTWFDYKGVKIMVPLEIVESLRAAIMGEKGE